MSEEGASSLGECYISTYPLSETYAYSTYTNYTSAPHHTGYAKRENGKEVPVFFHDNTLINWGIFTKPRHPLFYRTLQHIVEIVTSEYHRVSFLNMRRWDKRWKMVMCTTGFVLTYTLRHLELEGSLSNTEIPRILSNNFKQYQGNVKAFWTGGDPNHYMKAMTKKNLHILKDFAPLDMNRILDFLHGRTVMGDNGREIYLIYYRQRYTFGDYDTFLSLGFSDRDSRHLTDSLLEAIPLGGIVKNKEFLQELDKKHIASMVTAPVSGGATATGTATISGSSSDSSSSSQQLKEVEQFLPKLVDTLNNLPNKIGCWSDDYTGSRDDYIKGTYSSYLNNTPVLIYPFCAKTFQLGNTLGYYLNDLACAVVSGAHFITVNKQFTYIDINHLQTKNEHDRDTFFQHLPLIYINKQPLHPIDVKLKMKKECDCLQYCWENKGAPWLKRIPLIKEALMPAIDAYVKITDAERRGTVLNTSTDFTTITNYKPDRDWLPLVPNVTIQYRCGDNIGFGKTRYGLLPFAAYSKTRIPIQYHENSFIYIIADSPSRQQYHVYSSRCETILQHLLDDLKKKFPKNIIIVKRGDDQFLDYARIAKTSIVFCSASTFCLWPALANDKATIYYPLTPLVAGAWDNETAPVIAENFHWIREVEMIKQFKHYRPWTKLIDDLETITTVQP